MNIGADQISKLLTGLVNGYRWIVKPLLPPACRFQPSCSQYALESLEKHELRIALMLIIKRLVRCNPFMTGGYDPVPKVDERVDNGGLRCNHNTKRE